MKVYRSKIDIWLVVLVFAPFIVVLYTELNAGTYDSLYFLLPIMALIISFYWQIKYIIQDNYLIVKAGIFGSTKIPVSDIKSVHKTNNPLSAPALSIQRLEVKYGKFDYQLISPEHKELFVQELKAINPSIDVKI